MAAYRRVYDSRHLQADCQEPELVPEPYARYSQVWATFIPFSSISLRDEVGVSLCIQQRSQQRDDACSDWSGR